MGVCQPSPEWKAQQQRKRPKSAWQKKKEAEYSQYAAINYQRLRYYGKPVDEKTKEFIKKNYNSNYKATTKLLNGSVTQTYVYEVQQRLKTAYQNRYQTYQTMMIDVDLQKRILRYYWVVKTPKLIYYNATVTFDEQNKFLSIVLQQYYNETKYVKLQDQTQPSPYNTIKPKYKDPDYEQSEYYGPGPDNVDYNALLQKQNQEFRDKMNKQAEEWNNYARQANKRGGNLGMM